MYIPTTDLEILNAYSNQTSVCFLLACKFNGRVEVFPEPDWLFCNDYENRRFGRDANFLGELFVLG